MAIGRRIKEARLNKSLTQEELAKLVGVTKGAIANYENNTSHPKENVMYALINALGVDANFLFQDFVETKKAPSLSDEAMKLAKDYDGLDEHGQRVIRLVANEEKARCMKPLQEVPQEPEKVRYITKWFPTMPMSAGTGQPAGYEEAEELELTKRPPRSSSFVAPVSGDSMEPTFHDGDKLFIRICEEIEPGQIGVFYMDGQLYVKELGDTALISHNPAYDPIPMQDDIRCQGLVLDVCDESYFE